MKYGYIKIFIVFIASMLFRLLPLRAPNVEPIMASIMPLGRKYGALWVFLFAVGSIFLYDLLTNFGSWTFTVAFAYGVVALLSNWYFKNREGSVKNFAIFAFWGTIFFDLFTGVLVAPLLGKSIYTAFMLQIPFTALHLAGNIGFAITLSPVLDRWLASSSLFTISRTPKVVLNN